MSTDENKVSKKRVQNILIFSLLLSKIMNANENKTEYKKQV